LSPLAGIDYDHRTKKRGVYKIVGKGHKGWSPNVDKELGNYDYLLGADVKTFICALAFTPIDSDYRSTFGTQMSKEI
jgi:hypothetical protein